MKLFSRRGTSPGQIRHSREELNAIGAAYPERPFLGHAPARDLLGPSLGVHSEECGVRDYAVSGKAGDGNSFTVRGNRPGRRREVRDRERG